mmetsp:Transcript_41742/g.105238  ORF Transcript_41742/g.105238 Transcript_41742/m.105238 type:complete len:119 (+) Transcript_41742:79-435(+)|eukprot:CAMPEP_0177650544 /NCGR_PEP_ID=MMETSP0447-20121125/12000_1 /TAXON_ID=0 /ORGANISM="Stygamoeba regulata, Strain BSH-02190019" /LENGTH=118 /DNA_ID=CAMNT_0019153423 /DNA_START=79 /DNA_END=435 /DNA_ORIENTATION=+
MANNNNKSAAAKPSTRPPPEKSVHSIPLHLALIACEALLLLLLVTAFMPNTTFQDYIHVPLFGGSPMANDPVFGWDACFHLRELRDRESVFPYEHGSEGIARNVAEGRRPFDFLREYF